MDAPARRPLAVTEAERAAIREDRDNPLHVTRSRYLDFLRIVGENGPFTVEKRSFTSYEPATAPVPFILRFARAPKAEPSPAPDSTTRKNP